MNTNKMAIAFTSLALLSTPAVQAADIKWNGFMSVAAGKTLDDDTTYLVDPITGGTYDDEIQFAPESMMGLQAQSSISDKMRATVQVVAHGGDGYNAKVEWAYLSYDLTDSLTMNAGRLRLPLYFYSDFLDVGYAYHWIRPPADVYSAPISGVEGVSFRHSTLLGSSVELQTEIWYGATDIELSGRPAELRDDIGINALLTWEWLKFRLLYNDVDISLEVPGVGTTELPITYTSAALMADYNSFVWRSEFTEIDNDGAKTPSWYVSLGYQIGDFMPHITSSNTNPDYSISLDPATGAPRGVDSETSSTIVGISWNFDPSAVLKLEYIDQTMDTGTTDLIGGGVTSTSEDTSVIAIAIDLVF